MIVPNFRDRRVQIVLGIAALILVALSIRFAPPWLRADTSAELPVRGINRRLFMACAGVSALLLVIAMLRDQSLVAARQIKLWLIAGVLLLGTVEMFLLPPFQGPDETVHWQTALTQNRSRVAVDESVLYSLSQTLQSDVPALDPKAHFKSVLFRAQPIQTLPGEIVNYANRLSYPFVSAVSLFFPRVQTMQEALVFYYLCRFLPLLSLVLLLLWINRRFELPYVAIVFFSMPLVLQQFLVISTDTVTNFCVLLIAVLFARLWRRPSNIELGVLAGLLLVAASNKPVVWGLFAALLFFLPYSRIPQKKFLLPLAAIVSLVIVWMTARYVSARITHLAPTTETLARAAELESWDGIKGYLAAFKASMVATLSFGYWVDNLGWLNTPLSVHHIALLRFTVLFALLADIGHALLRVADIKHNLRVLGLALLLCAFFAVTLALSMCAILFIAHNPPNLPFIMGMQTRYLFPAVIFALVLPLLAFNDLYGPFGPIALWKKRVSMGLCAFAAGFLPLMFFSRGIECAVDLFSRYW